ncbi:hypothetical protein [Niastella sp. OAS944]|uniref:hypothetical protein n=1 Tax=Niastella sp. OAS944 TaxID=2664089 RepID=UPI0034833730|nr:hypothetical protein [Chitinophagaceae bacterium OAS944]
MKIVSSLFIAMLFMSCSAYNQVSNAPATEKNPQVNVKDWGKMKMMVGEEIWNNAAGEIVSQIGAEEFAAVKKHYDYKSIPAAMSLASENNRKNVDKFYQRLSALKIFKVATFNSVSNGKNWGKSVILKVPYEGNQEWDKNIKWDSVYIIINEEEVENI